MKNLFLGSDVSKGYMDIIVLDEFGKELIPTERFYDTPNGHCELIQVVKSVLDDKSVIYAGVESTGGYENNWMKLFSTLSNTLPLHYVRINPRVTANSAKTKLTRSITDKVSAFVIADYLRRYHDEIRFDEEDPFKSLKRLWTSHRLLVKSHSSHWMQLQSVLYDSNPAILKYTRSRVPQWFLQVLKSYPTAAKLSRAKMSKLTSIPYVMPARAQELISDAKQSVAADSEECTAFLIKQLVIILLDLEKNKKVIDKQLVEEAKDLPGVELLESIQGISKVSAVGYMINIGDISRFSNVKKFAAYWGVHPVFKESGDGKSIPKMSKAGRSHPRAMLYMSAMAGVQSNPVLKKQFEKHKELGKIPRAAIGICMHQLLRIMYGVLKSGKPFDPLIHDKDQLKRGHATTNSKQEAVTNEKYDTSAPISSREAKRQKGRIAESQEFRKTQERDHQPPTQ